MSNLHTILAINPYKKDSHGNPMRRRFTFASWNAIPFMSIGTKRIPKQGWVQVSENIPDEAAEIINNGLQVSENIPDEAAEAAKAAEINKDEPKPLEKMKGIELLEYITKNGIEIENAESLTKSQLINEIRKISARD